MFAISDQMLQCGAARRPMLPIERKWKSNVEIAPNCPRCASANTKFCYYNNYSLSQPRYFCKGCRRYWTKGGSLRNVPVGGGYRKSRKGKSSRVEKSGGGHLSMNYCKNFSSFESRQEQVIGVSSSSDRDSGNQPGPAASGSEIDLAVIFAQFLNQTTSLDQPAEILTQESPNEGIDVWSFVEQDTNSQNDSSMECPELPVVHAIPESYILQEMPQVKQQQLKENNSGQELLETDQMNAFGLMETDQMDASWSNDAAATNTNFEWQPMVPLQQLESFPIDDQLKISANLMAENWNCFDLSGFELFSKP